MLKNNFYLNCIFKIIILFNFFFCSLTTTCTKDLPILKNNQCVSYCDKDEFISGECEIVDPIMKTKWLNNIISFENTNGKFFLSLNEEKDMMAFITTLSNNKDRIFYVIKRAEEYIIKNNTDNSYIPYTQRKVPQIEVSETTNFDIIIITLNYNYLILIGNEKSYIQVYNLDIFDQEPDIIPPSTFFNESIIVKGVHSLSYIYNSNSLIYVTIAATEENPSDYFLSFYLFIIIPLEKTLSFQFKGNYKFYDIKGNYASCSPDELKKFILCFYINKKNQYIFTLFLKDGDSFTIKGNSYIIEEFTETTINTKSFFKIGFFSKSLINFAYYSGESNSIPTILYKKLDNSNQLIDAYSTIPKIHLNGHNGLFSNELEYNGLVNINGDILYFISTNEKKELIVIVEFRLFGSTSKKKLALRYFIIELKKNYNMRILNGLKAVYYYSESIILAFNYCYDSSCNNLDNKNGNAALIKLSYFYKKANNITINFIDYSFNNNTNYITIDLKEDIVIENNIFGLEFNRIITNNEDELMEYNANFYLVNSGDNLLESYIALPDDSILNITFTSYNKITIPMIFGSGFYSTESLDEYNKLCDYFDNTYGNSSDSSSFKAMQKTILILFYCYIDINKNLSDNDCIDSNCSLCLKDEPDYCLVCRDEYTIINHKNFTYGKKKFCIKNYRISGLNIEEYINGKHKDENLSNEEIQNLYEELKDFINNEYNGSNTIINTGNVHIQISNIDTQKYSKELSNVDLGECGEILKNKYCKDGNDSLIMLKFDIKPENEKSTYVQYEVYDSNSKKFLNLEECLDSNILINIPLELDSNIELLYNLLSNSGYNLFNSSDSFYNDICSTYTTQNNTDILLYDRRMDIYQSTINISLCQAECEFQSYDTESKKAKCNCQIKKKKVNLDLSNIKFDKNEMLDKFYETLQNSNFRVLKCYKLAFSFIIFKTNIGSIIMTILLVIFLILSIINKFVGSKKINNYIQQIMKNKYIENENKSAENDSKTEEKNNNKCEENNVNKIKKNDRSLNSICETLNSNKSPKRKKRKKKKKLTANIIEFNHNTEYNKIIASNNINSNNSSTQYKYLNMDLKNAPSKRRSKKINTQKNIEPIIIFQRSISRSNSNKINYNPKPLILDLSDNKSNNEKEQNNNDINNNINNNNNDINNDIKNNNAIKNNNDIKNNNEENKPEQSLKEMLKVIRKKKKKSSFRFKSPQKPRKRITFVDNPNALNSNNKVFSPQNPEKTEVIKLEDKKPKEIELNSLKSLNDEELNSLKYEEAIELDKRTYCKYYLSLLFKKQLILFCFFPSNDYNVMSLKITLFLVSFSLYLTINGFFFNDKTMHKIYKDNGVFNIIFQIPQILYSSIVTSVINVILKNLSLSEKEILKIKQEKSIKNTVNISKNIEKCIKIKFIIFFLFSLLLMLFFWYFISCFCAVYNNTQTILFKDTILSFGLSMLYPFGLNLLPGLARIPSLQAEKKNKKCLYSFSQILALLL